ncbi:MAG: hypothetical protein Q9217_002836 [Psora testacea]
MASVDSRASSWNNVAKAAALNTIDRFLAGTDQTGVNTRDQGVRRNSTVADGKVAQPKGVTQRNDLQENPRGPSIDNVSSVSSQHSAPISYITAHSKQLSSCQSLSSSATNKDNKPMARKDDKTFIAPHLRAGLPAAGCQSLAKDELVASIRGHSETRGSQLASNKPPTKNNDGELIAAQQCYPIPPPIQARQPTPTRNSSKPNETSTSYVTSSPDHSHLLKPAYPNDRPVQTTSEPMNSGTAAKSAKSNAKFPCSYDDCSMGFGDKRALNEHKYTEHEGWCKTCDIDTEDDKALLVHKMSSLKHVCCQFCGKDFHTEAARNLHEERTHGPKRNVKCIGCHTIFDTGSSLILHIYSNRCRDPRGQVREKTIRENRVIAALSLERLANEGATASTWDSQTGSVAGESSMGGVPIQQSLLDSDLPSQGLHKPRKNLLNDAFSVSGDDDEDDVLSTTTAKSDRTVLNKDDNASLRTGKTMGTRPEGGVIEGLESLNLGGTAPQKPKTKTMAKALFADVKATPNIGGSHASSYSASQPAGAKKTTDWDHLHFDKDNITGEWICPFGTCGVRSKEIDPLKEHLQSGYHYGTDNQCVKCLKKFEKVDRLIAHMESDSIRCGIKWTRRYGHIIHILSGGFLGVARDEYGRPHLKEVENPDPAAPISVEEDDFCDPCYASW